MLDDPLTVANTSGLNAADLTASFQYSGVFVCTGRGPTSSTYRLDFSSSNWIELFVGHQFGKRNRYTIRLTESELVADPIDSTKNSVRTESAYVVVDRSLLGASTHAAVLASSLARLILKPTDGVSTLDRVLVGET